MTWIGNVLFFNSGSDCLTQRRSMAILAMFYGLEARATGR